MGLTGCEKLTRSLCFGVLWLEESCSMGISRREALGVEPSFEADKLAGYTN